MSSRCEMAKQKYCRKSSFGYCEAEVEDIERCPYLQAIREISSLSVENMKLEEKFLDDGK